MSAIIQGTILNNKYRVERILGVSSMGAVCEAVHMLLGRKVVIRQLHPMFAQHTKIVQRFFEVVQKSALLENPHICEVIDIGYAENGAPYWVTSFLSGKSLDAVIKADGPLPLGRAVDIVIQTLSALGNAHDMGIIHQDLKPDKIFVVDNTGKVSDFVKILDLGVFKTVYDEFLQFQSWSGVWMSPPCYMSPEQASGNKNLRSRSNLYTMGAILYECLTGRKPYEGDDYNGILFKIITQPFASPRSIFPQIPIAVEDVILKAMDRDPSCRYATAAQMQSDLERAFKESEIGRRLPFIINSEFEETVDAPNPQSEQDTSHNSTIPSRGKNVRPDLPSFRSETNPYVVITNDDIEDSWEENDDFQRTIRVDKLDELSTPSTDASAPVLPSKPDIPSLPTSSSSATTILKSRGVLSVIGATLAILLLFAAIGVYITLRMNNRILAVVESVSQTAQQSTEGETSLTKPQIARQSNATVLPLPPAPSPPLAPPAPPMPPTQPATEPSAPLPSPAISSTSPNPLTHISEGVPTPATQSAPVTSGLGPMNGNMTPPASQASSATIERERTHESQIAPKTDTNLADTGTTSRSKNKAAYHHGKLGSKIGSNFE